MAQITPPQRQDTMQSGISSDAGMAAIQSQQQLAAQVNQAAGTVAQTAMLQSQENAKYFEGLKASIADAEYSKVYSKAILDFTGAVNERKSKILDDKGNPTFATLSEDIGRIGNDIYNKYAAEAGPLIANRFKQSFNNVITNSQAESFATSRKQANEWILGQAATAKNALTKTAMEGSPSVSTESTLEFEKQIDGYVANGVISPTEGVSAKEDFKKSVGIVRGQNLLQLDPEALMLGTAPGTDDSYLQANGIFLDPAAKQQLNFKAQQEVARRAQEAAAAQNAAVDTMKDTYTEMNKVIENGGRLDPLQIETLSNQLDAIGTKKAADLKRDVQTLANKAHAITQFSTLGEAERREVLLEYERSGNLGTAYETLKRTDANINSNLNKDPYAYAISQQTVTNYQPFDPSGNVQEQLAKRRQDISQIRSRFGVESSGLTNQEVDALTKHMNNMAPDEVASMYGQIVGGLGAKSINLFKAMAKNGDTQNALIGVLVLSGREDVASKVLQGQAAIKNDKNLGLSVSNKDVQESLKSIMSRSMPETANTAYTNDVLSLARAIYAQKSVSEKDFSGEFDRRRFEDAVKDAQGGEPVYVMGKGIFNRDQSKIVTPVAGMDADGFENWIKGLKDSDIQALGGWKGFTSGMAQQLPNSKLQQYGPGTYLVMVPSKASETGYTPVLNAQTGKPFVLDYKQIMDNRTAPPASKTSTRQSGRAFDAKNFVKMVDFSVTGQVSAEPEVSTSGPVAKVSGFIKNAVIASPQKLAPYKDAISNSASINNLNENLVKAIILTESMGNQGAVSHKGARGLMQITEGAAKDVGLNITGTPHNNIEIGSRYISFLLKKYKGNLDLALAAYNAGMGRVQGKVPNIKETQEYVQKVKGIFGQLNQGKK